jgi:hypothetical protein
MSTMDVRVSFSSRSLYPGAMNILYPTDRRFCEPHRRCDDKFLVPLPQSEPRFIGPPDRSLFAVQTELSKLQKPLPKTLKVTVRSVSHTDGVTTNFWYVCRKAGTSTAKRTPIHRSTRPEPICCTNGAIQASKTFTENHYEFLATRK